MVGLTPPTNCSLLFISPQVEYNYSCGVFACYVPGNLFPKNSLAKYEY
jgi:hypothetical protein